MSGAHRYADWDAAYVLGSLSAADRQEYEGHLAQCPSCREAVAELAGMPGLLAQVPAGEALALGFPDEELLLARPPASLMPALPREPALAGGGPGWSPRWRPAPRWSSVGSAAMPCPLRTATPRTHRWRPPRAGLSGWPSRRLPRRP